MSDIEKVMFEEGAAAERFRNCQYYLKDYEIAAIMEFISYIEKQAKITGTKNVETFLKKFQKNSCIFKRYRLY
ncbi:MAG: hypothetical protein IIW48_07865 [Clostridia bacterium]|nr:hypothetical protein [Clostridia bacterium]